MSNIGVCLSVYLSIQIFTELKGDIYTNTLIAETVTPYINRSFEQKIIKKTSVLHDTLDPLAITDI